MVRWSDGQMGEIEFALPIVKSLEEDICYLADYNWYRRPGSLVFDFRQKPIRLASTFTELNLYPTDQFILATDEEADFYGDKISEAIQSEDGADRHTRAKLPYSYEATVYNIEIEDFHTYFVGGAGVWVHNKEALTD